jgi:hypothetical protein
MCLPQCNKNIACVLSKGQKKKFTTNFYCWTNLIAYFIWLSLTCDMCKGLMKEMMPTGGIEPLPLPSQRQSRGH